MLVTMVRGSLVHSAQYSGARISQCRAVGGGEGRAEMSDWGRVSYGVRRALSCERRTNECQPDQACDADDQAHDVEQEVLVVVHANASVHPWTVAAKLLAIAAPWEICYTSTYWSCLATQRPQRRQCLLRRGLRIIHGVQKCFSLKIPFSSRSSIVFFVCPRLLLLGM